MVNIFPSFLQQVHSKFLKCVTWRNRVPSRTACLHEYISCRQWTTWCYLRHYQPSHCMQNWRPRVINWRQSPVTVENTWPRPLLSPGFSCLHTRALWVYDSHPRSSAVAVNQAPFSMNLLTTCNSRQPTVTNFCKFRIGRQKQVR